MLVTSTVFNPLGCITPGCAVAVAASLWLLRAERAAAAEAELLEQAAATGQKV